jgi:polysaccharide export outer membrane protein
VGLKVTLLGEIAKSGNYQIEGENFNLIDLLGKSGGFLPSSDAGKVKIIRGNKTHPEIIFVNLKNIHSLSSGKLILQNDDIIYVSAKRLFNTTEGLKGYISLLQPMFLVFNTIILVATLKNL